jgi:hypothetical protein
MPAIVGFVANTTLPLPVVAVTLNVPSLPDVVTIPLVVKLPNFLLVKLSEPAKVAIVPELGNVTDDPPACPVNVTAPV